jgi:hypothetical protein
MYLVLEYVTYLVIVTVLAGILFGASVLAILTKDKAPKIAEASRRAIQEATRRIEETHLGDHLPGRSPAEGRQT